MWDFWFVMRLYVEIPLRLSTSKDVVIPYASVQQETRSKDWGGRSSLRLSFDVHSKLRLGSNAKTKIHNLHIPVNTYNFSHCFSLIQNKG